MSEDKKTTTTRKRRPKGEIKYKFSLNEEQKRVKEDIFNSEIVVINSKAGSGKTACVAMSVLDLLFKKEITSIYVSRPTVEVGVKLGFLPGSVEDKTNPYLDSFKEALFDCYNKEKVLKHLQNGDIKGEAIQFIRGKNFGAGEVLVVDEVQNASVSEVYAILTRLAKGGRIILIGDIDQVDTRESYTGLHYVIDMANKIEEIKLHSLKQNHRSVLVAKIIDYEYSRKKQ